MFANKRLNRRCTDYVGSGRGGDKFVPQSASYTGLINVRCMNILTHCRMEALCGLTWLLSCYAVNGFAP